MKVFIAMSFAWIAMFGLVQNVDAAEFKGCCLYFQNDPPKFDACVEPVSINSEASWDSSTEFVANNSGSECLPDNPSEFDIEDFKNAGFVPYGYAGAYEITNTSKGCIVPKSSVVTYKSEKLLGTQGSLNGQNIDVKKWCDVGEKFGPWSGWQSQYDAAVAEETQAGKFWNYAGKSPDQDAATGLTCCIYREGPDWSDQCYKISDFLVHGDNATKFSCSGYDASKDSINQIMPINFVGGAFDSAATTSCPSFKASSPYSFVYQDVYKNNKFQTFTKLPNKPLAYDVCLAGQEVGAKTDLNSIIEQWTEQKAENAANALDEVKKYIDAKKKEFCCIPKKRTSDTSCYDPHPQEASIQEMANVIGGLQTQPGFEKFTPTQVLDTIYGAQQTVSYETAGSETLECEVSSSTGDTTCKVTSAGAVTEEYVVDSGKNVFAAVFYSCNPSGSVVLSSGSGFPTAQMSSANVVYDNHMMVLNGCEKSAILPAFKGVDLNTGELQLWPPCASGDIACEKAMAEAFPGGMEGMTLSKWCAAPKLFCACRKDKEDCIDLVYDGKVTTGGAATEHPQCTKDAQTRGPDWECKSYPAKKIYDLSKGQTGGAAGADNCCVLTKSGKCGKQPAEFECVGAPNVPIFGAASDPKVLLKQVCTKCDTAKVKINGTVESCTKNIVLPAINVFPNPVDAKGINSPQTFIANLISTFLGIIGSIALGLVVYGGVVWMTAAGVPARVDTGRKTVIWASVGLVAVFVSTAVVRFIFSVFG